MPNKGQTESIRNEMHPAKDLFTHTAAILKYFDLRSIIGCPGGMSTFRLYFRALFETFFLKVLLE